ncbi:hypothetical protein M5689_021709 [Euphorbia peplus]|nr:hypothetical protein M5689_021709 [Euphorbia peplus]
MEDDKVKISKKWLQQLAKGVGSKVDVLTSTSLQVLLVQKGLIRCRFVVPDCLTDGDGNWEVGAMATLIDNIAGATIHSFAGQIKPTISFTISFFSTAKSQEEVEIEAKVEEEKGKLSALKIEIKKKENGKVIASAKQWTAPIINNNAISGRASPFWNTLNTHVTRPISKL